MIAVACGTRLQVRQWGEVLRRAAIDYLVAEGTEAAAKADSRVEVWVSREDAEEARLSLRASGRAGEKHLW
jgi:hypothetical protein